MLTCFGTKYLNYFSILCLIFYLGTPGTNRIYYLKYKNNYTIKMICNQLLLIDTL
jgi:hypothetical protein